jgi:hypothetical protein
MTLMLGFGSTFAGDLIRRFDPRVLLTVGPVIAGAGFLLLALPGENASFVTGFLPAILVVGLGMTISVAPLTTVVMSSMTRRQTGVASGINNTVSRLAGVIAVAILTGIAIVRFSAGLELELQRSDVPAAAVASLLSDAAQLAELGPPAGVTAAVARTIDASVAASYIATFRLLAIICGGLALASGMVAWFTLREAAPAAAAGTGN